MTTIRQFAASRDGSLLAAGEFESIVHLWDLNSMTRLKTFETTLDFGGDRLAVSPDGSLLAVGAYYRHGIAVYRTSNGSELWRRKDLKKVQRLRFSQDGNHLFCCFDNSACERLNASDGKSGQTLRGIRNLWTSHFRSVHLFERSRDLLVADNKAKVAVIPKMSFAVLSAAFSPSQVCVSEAGGSLRLFSLETGALVWRHDPSKGTHFLWIAYASSNNQFVGVSWPYEHGGSYVLHRFNNETGEAFRIADAPSWHECLFCRDGSRLVTSSGAVIEVASGRLEATLAFPPKPAKANEA